MEMITTVQHLYRYRIDVLADCKKLGLEGLMVARQTGWRFCGCVIPGVASRGVLLEDWIMFLETSLVVNTVALLWTNYLVIRGDEQVLEDFLLHLEGKACEGERGVFGHGHA